jgi:hypothetical protein
MQMGASGLQGLVSPPSQPGRTVADIGSIGYMNLAAPVAQLDRALPSEGKGHTFESCRVRQLFQSLNGRTKKTASRLANT